MIPGAFGSEITKIPHMDEVLRRHSLDHMIVFSEAHLRRIVGAYAACYNESTTHRSLNKTHRSIALFSASASSRHSPSSADFTTNIEQIEANGRNNEQVHGGDDIRSVVTQEGTLPLGGGPHRLTMYFATLD